MGHCRRHLESVPIMLLHLKCRYHFTVILSIVRKNIAAKALQSVLKLQCLSMTDV